MRSIDLFLVLSIFLLPGGLSAAARTEDRDVREAFARPGYVSFPDAAPYSPQAAALGRMLFFDPRISGAQNMSCSSCHNPSFGWETPVARAIGALNQPLDRHAPTVENLAEAPYLFWDGRASSLEEQAIGPITHPKEMNADLAEVIGRLARIGTYRQYFEIAFPGEGMTEQTLLRAIATYERTLRSGWAPFDDWVEGQEAAISDAAKRGFDLFVGDAACATCHTGWAFTDHRFHSVGVISSDPGRSEVEEGAGRVFKTPGLRNIALRAPYMHNGSLPTLRSVIWHYRRQFPSETPDVPAIRLSDSEAQDI